MKRKLLILFEFTAVGVLFYRILTNGVQVIDLLLCFVIYVVCMVALFTLKS
ncbi:hypothetical protein [Pseudarcicella hirudinis]|uniref:hypothetical protein n=1 Tax=Pseudarcicella hirudinis TaxID=1079859 RepID=UPI0015A70C34|nr:hypothetical protein [Pseudarcicella hirudinis]